MTAFETPYVETNALLAIMNGDRETAAEILADSSDRELQKLDDQLQFLRDVITAMLLARAHQRRVLNLDARTVGVLKPLAAVSSVPATGTGDAR